MKATKLFTTIGLALFTVIITIYYLSFCIMPSVTVINQSTTLLTKVQLTLPSSQLDFGVIPAGESNTLYYSLSQPKDGQYQYTIITQNGDRYHNRCGYVTDKEINKRITLTIQTRGRIICH